MARQHNGRLGKEDNCQVGVFLGKPAPLAEVQAAVKRLYAAQFIRNSEEGWKLQTAQEKNPGSFALTRVLEKREQRQ